MGAGGNGCEGAGRRVGTFFCNRVSLQMPNAAAHRSRLVNLEATMNPSLVKRDPEIMSGALCFTGARVPVKNLFVYLEGTSSLEEFLEDL